VLRDRVRRGREGKAWRAKVARVVGVALVVAGVGSGVSNAAAPQIVEESSVNVAATSATLQATVNPGGIETTVYFQYGLTTTYGSDAPALPGEDIGAGSTGTQVGPIHLQGLAAETTYHYRVVARREPEGEPVEEVDGPDQTFRTQPTQVPALPDGRSWEMVTPPNKRAAVVEAIGQEGVIQAAADGRAITYFTNAPTDSSPPGYANEQQMLSSRGSAGWDTRDLAIPHVGATGASEGVGEDYRFFSTDLATALVQPAGAFTPLSPEASEQTAYTRANFPDGEATAVCPTAEQESAGVSCFRPLVTGEQGFANVPPGTVFGELGNTGGEVGPCPSISAICGPQFVGATADGKHVIISTSVVPVDLTTTPAPRGGLYEWTGGVLTLVSLLPEAEGATPASSPGLGDITGRSVRNAVSPDGSRVFWVGLNGSEEEHLYMRDLGRNETVELDAGLSGPGKFQIASKDGTVAYFTDEETLYECGLVVSGGKLQCELSNLGSEVQGQVIGASEDGSWVYFVSNAVLAAGAPAGTCNGGVSQPGATCGLYVRHDHETKLVAVLSGADSPDWARGPQFQKLNELTARVSPNGQWLAFQSQQSLTGYDNRDAVSGRPDEEVYLYDAHEGVVRCASCDPTGSRPVGEEYGEHRKRVGGDRIWSPSTWLAANIPGWTPWANSYAQYQSRYLSDTGRLFFNSHEALVPQDANGTWDVYEYEPTGLGTCSAAEATFSATSNGCVNLISSGTAGEESAFLDASATGGAGPLGGEGGGDVFFLTSAKLAPQDFDTSVDIYDAHECSAIAPCLSAAPAPPAPCATTDTCRPGNPGAPEAGPAATETLSGPGNVHPSSTAGNTGKLTAKQIKAKALARALKACRRKTNRHKRAACEKHARRTFGVKAQRKPARATRRPK
jgi:hypothetical protein